MNLDISIEFPFVDCFQINTKQKKNDVTVEEAQNGTTSGVKSDSAANLSDAEHSILTDKALRNKVLPTELNESKPTS